MWKNQPWDRYILYGCTHTLLYSRSYVGFEEKQYREFAAFHSSHTEIVSLLRRNTAALFGVWFLASKEHVASTFKGQAVFLNYFTLVDATCSLEHMKPNDSHNNMASRSERPESGNNSDTNDFQIQHQSWHFH